MKNNRSEWVWVLHSLAYFMQIFDLIHYALLILSVVCVYQKINVGTKLSFLILAYIPLLLPTHPVPHLIIIVKLVFLQLLLR